MLLQKGSQHFNVTLHCGLAMLLQHRVVETCAMVTSRGALPAPHAHTHDRSRPTGQDEIFWCQKIRIDPCHLQQEQQAQSRLWSFQGAKHSPHGKGTFLRLQSCWLLLGSAQMDLRSPFICLSSPLAKQPFPFPSPSFVFRPSKEIPPCSARKPARAGLRFVLFQAYLRFQTIMTADIVFPWSDG